MSVDRLTAAGLFGTATEFRLSAGKHHPDLSDFNRFVTMTITTGACSVQTYLTPNECDRLADMLRDMGAEVRALLAAQVVSAQEVAA